MDDVYLIWSNEHMGWWGPGRHGYTRDLVGAGHYMREEALEICRKAVLQAPHVGMIAELPVRLADIAEFLEGQKLPRAIATGEYHP